LFPSTLARYLHRHACTLKYKFQIQLLKENKCNGGIRVNADVGRYEMHLERNMLG
jgi:hypothetical protein